MTLDVAATANHWWADGAVSCALLVLCVGAERAVRALRVPRLEPVLAPTLLA
jgi:hypothetical protein